MTIPSKGHRNAAQQPVYALRIDDLVEIKFFNNEQFNEIVKVRPDGRISLAKIDEIFVLGMTTVELDSIITKSYAKIIKNPEITIIVREFGAQHVFVLGQVNSPGGYPIYNNMSLLHVIAVAGGLRPNAEPRSIMILRRKNAHILSAYKIDATRSLKQSQHLAINQDPLVQAMDIVYVPKTYFASASTFLKQLYEIILPPFDVYLRAWWYSELISR